MTVETSVDIEVELQAQLAARKLKIQKILFLGLRILPFTFFLSNLQRLLFLLRFRRLLQMPLILSLFWVEFALLFLVLVLPLGQLALLFLGCLLL
jgi:hypothetical protein